MIDTMTRKLIAVETDGGTVPYVVVVVDQLGKVIALLEANSIPYYVDEEYLSMDGGPAVATVNFARHADPERLQRLLDSIP